jgi:hypothetical protein
MKTEKIKQDQKRKPANPSPSHTLNLKNKSKIAKPIQPKVKSTKTKIVPKKQPQQISKQQPNRLSTKKLTKKYIKVFRRFVHAKSRQSKQELPLNEFLRDVNSIVENRHIQKANLTLSNSSNLIVNNIIGNTTFKGGSLAKITPMSSYVLNRPNSLLHRPYKPTNNTDTFETLSEHYRSRNLLREQQPFWAKQDLTRISPYIRKIDEPFKPYRANLRRIVPNFRALPYAQLLGTSIGKINPLFLPWVRKRGEVRTHFFRKRKHKISIYEFSPYEFLLNKRRPSRLFKPSKSILKKYLTDKHRKRYVLAQLQSYPIKAQNSFLKILIYC